MDDLSYIINQLGEDRENYFNAVAPPVIKTSNFACKTVEEFRKLILDESSGALYTRGKNPTVQILAKKIAALDGAEEALIFSSGVTAITVPILHLLKQGDHIVSVRNAYSWATKFFTELLPKFGIECTFVDGTDAENYFKAVKPNTKLFYFESPNTYTFELQDITSICAFAKKRGMLTIADNSYSSPLFMKPIQMGVDLCIQSASKYLGGHSDIIAGVLTGSSKLLTQIFKSTYMNIGGIISPDNAWLMIRSLRTMELRLNKISESTKQVVDFLSAHPKIERVVWPFHISHPQHELAKKQMKAGAGLFGFFLKTDNVDKIEAFCNSLERFLLAVSWGGHESLLIPICATIPKNEFDAKNEKHRYIRMYIGLENPVLLIKDIETRLKNI